MLEKIWDMNNAASLYLSNIVRLIYVALKEYALTQLCQRRALYLQCRATILSAQPYTDKFQLEMSSPSSSSYCFLCGGLRREPPKAALKPCCAIHFPTGTAACTAITNSYTAGLLLEHHTTGTFLI